MPKTNKLFLYIKIRNTVKTKTIYIHTYIYIYSHKNLMFGLWLGRSNGICVHLNHYNVPILKPLTAFVAGFSCFHLHWREESPQHDTATAGFSNTGIARSRWRAGLVLHVDQRVEIRYRPGELYLKRKSKKGQLQICSTLFRFRFVKSVDRLFLHTSPSFIALCWRIM